MNTQKTYKECPLCNQNSPVAKNGRARGKPRWKCKRCGGQFTRMEKKGVPLRYKKLWEALYLHLGLSYAEIARIYGVAPSSVQRWVKKNPSYKKKRNYSSVRFMDVHDMLHHICKKREKEASSETLWVGITHAAPKRSFFLI